MPICNLSELIAVLPKGSCLLGIDPGSTVLGIAVSDPNLSVASPLVSLTRGKFTADMQALAAIIGERRIGGIIIGLPKNMDGTEGPAAQSARTFASNLLKANIPAIASMPIVFWDERMSSAAVERFLIEDNMTRKRRGEVIDKAAAAYILQGALDRLKYIGSELGRTSP